jgi:hypothetical protein
MRRSRTPPKLAWVGCEIHQESQTAWGTAPWHRVTPFAGREYGAHCAFFSPCFRAELCANMWGHAGLGPCARCVAEGWLTERDLKTLAACMRKGPQLRKGLSACMPASATVGGVCWSGGPSAAVIGALQKILRETLEEVLINSPSLPLLFPPPPPLSPNSRTSPSTNYALLKKLLGFAAIVACVESCEETSLHKSVLDRVLS